MSSKGIRSLVFKIPDLDRLVHRSSSKDCRIIEMQSNNAIAVRGICRKAFACAPVPDFYRSGFGDKRMLIK